MNKRNAQRTVRALVWAGWLRATASLVGDPRGLWVVVAVHPKTRRPVVFRTAITRQDAVVAKKLVQGPVLERQS